MKKQLLLGSALLAAISAFPQQAVQKAAVKAESRNMAAFLAQKFQMQMSPVEPSGTTNPNQAPAVQGPTENPAQRSSSAIPVLPQWQAFTGSMNIYGNLVETSRPLQYNDELHAISFIHRKAVDYAPEPYPTAQAESGSIVGMVSDNWGQDWDATLMWNDDDRWGRYPQGGIYLPSGSPTNARLNDAYMVAMGPVTGSGTGWMGNFFASKKLDTLGGAGNNNSVSSAFNATTFITNTAPFPSGKFDFARLDLSMTDDGSVRALGILADNVNGTGAAYGYKGASIVNGYFASGSFSWEADTIIPQYFTNSAGSQNISGTPHMCWNEAGTVGYVWFIGVRNPRPGQGDTLANMGYQPIVYKWTAANPVWTEMARMDFNDENMYGDVLRQIFAVRGDSTLGIPFFNLGEGMDGIVDRNDRLHIVSTVVGTFSKHPDSLGYTYLLTHADGQRYNFRHSPGLRPYIFDFTETNSGWKVTTIDSMSSEGPGTQPNSDGVDDNPWDNAGEGGTKVGADARIQLSRTPDGRYIVYTWAESDTAYTNQSRKWNSLPNVKARMAEVGVESGSAPASLVVHPSEINMTGPANATIPPYARDNRVAGKAVMHYTSPKCAVINDPNSSGVALGLPLTVSNNSFSPMQQLSPVTHWYLAAALDFDNLGLSSLDWPGPGVGLGENSLSANTKLYPNPAGTSASLNIGLNRDVNVEVTILNTMGQVVKAFTHKGMSGENNVEISVNDLATGIYMVNIKAGNAAGTKKLVVQH